MFHTLECFFGTDRDSQGDPEGEGVASCTHIRDAPHGHLSQTRAYHSLQTHSKPTPHLYTSTRAAGSISNAMTAALSPLVPENLNEGHLVSLGCSSWCRWAGTQRREDGQKNWLSEA